MTARRPIGVTRPLATMLGRKRRRWRGKALVPMIWRRRLRAGPAPAQETARPAPSAPAYAFNLTWIWPAGAAARAAPMRHFETRTREIVQAGRDPAPRGTNRLTILVERLWSHPDTSRPPRAAASPDMIAPQPARENRTRQALAAAPPAGAAERVWPRVNMPGPQAAHAHAHAAGAAPLRRRVPAMARANDAHIGKAPAGMVPARAPAAMAWRGAAPPAEVPAAEASRPPRPRAALVWRGGTENGLPLAASSIPAFGRRPSAELIWRRPSAGADESEAAAPHPASAATLQHSEIRADRPLAAAPPPSAAAPSAAAIRPAEMSRLVDEVVRRLDRIGRDERMRRGI